MLNFALWEDNTDSNKSETAPNRYLTGTGMYHSSKNAGTLACTVFKTLLGTHIVFDTRNWKENLVRAKS